MLAGLEMPPSLTIHALSDASRRAPTASSARAGWAVNPHLGLRVPMRRIQREALSARATQCEQRFSLKHLSEKRCDAVARALAHKTQRLSAQLKFKPSRTP